MAPFPSDITDITDVTGLRWGFVGFVGCVPAPSACLAAANHRVMPAADAAQDLRLEPLRPSALRVRRCLHRANALAIFQQRKRRVEFGLGAQSGTV